MRLTHTHTHTDSLARKLRVAWLLIVPAVTAAPCLDRMGTAAPPAYALFDLGVLSNNDECPDDPKCGGEPVCNEPQSSHAYALNNAGLVCGFSQRNVCVGGNDQRLLSRAVMWIPFASSSQTVQGFDSPGLHELDLLGTANEQYKTSVAREISEAGRIVGTRSFDTVTMSPMIESLPSLPQEIPPLAITSEIFDPQGLGFVRLPPGDPHCPSPDPCVLTIDPQDVTGSTAAWGINDANPFQVTGWTTTNVPCSGTCCPAHNPMCAPTAPPCRTSAYRWTHPGPIGFNLVGTCDQDSKNTWGYDISTPVGNSSGLVVGYASVCGDFQQYCGLSPQPTDALAILSEPGFPTQCLTTSNVALCQTGGRVARRISNSGLTVGWAHVLARCTPQCTSPPGCTCGIDCHRSAVTWDPGSTEAFWLGSVLPAGFPAPNDYCNQVSTSAYGVNDPPAQQPVQVVGAASGAGIATALLWKRDPNTLQWSATDLNTAVNPNCFFSLREAYDVNDNGWIVGWGNNLAGQERAFLLVPGSTCIGDVNCDAEVNTTDLLLVIGNWGTCPDPSPACPGDANFDGVVDVSDLLAVIGDWGWCFDGAQAAAPPDIQDCFELYVNDPDALRDCLENVLLGGSDNGN